MFYGPNLKKEGIDMDVLLTREEVFGSTWDQLSGKDMDILGPFHPEDDEYVVVRVLQSEKIIIIQVLRNLLTQL